MSGYLSYLKNLWSMVTQCWPPKSKFSVDQIPDLEGKVVIVTGATSGSGAETVKALLRRNAKVYLAVRSEDKARTIIESLKAETGKDAKFLYLDLSSLASVKKAAEEFIGKEPELHILFNNAGVMTPPIGLLTEEGYDLQFGTNVLGHYYFTTLLIPALAAGAKSSSDKHSRVIHTSSGAAYIGMLDFSTLKDEGELKGKSEDERKATLSQLEKRRKRLGTTGLYCQSKLAIVIMARQFAQRYADQGIVSISCHPGLFDSELYRNTPSWQKATLTWAMHPASHGALTQLWGGTMPEALNHNGEFLIPWARTGRCCEEAYNPKTGEDLWAWLERQVKDR